MTFTFDFRFTRTLFPADVTNNAGKIREFARVPRIEDYGCLLFRMESEVKS